MTGLSRILTVACLLLWAGMNAAHGGRRTGATAGRPAGARYAVICGVARYADSSMNLDYCDDDARDLYSQLLADPRWQAQNIALLIDAQATKQGIHDAIQAMAAVAQADDICLFFFSGHGTNGPDLAPFDEADGYDEYICPHDSAATSYAYDIRDDELADWIAAVPAQTILVALDTCYGGGQIVSSRDATTVSLRPPGIKRVRKPGSAASLKRGDGLAADLLRRSRRRDLNDLGNLVVLTACADDELSTEDPGLRNGVFTYYLVEGMAAAGTDLNRDGELSGAELFAYLYPRATAYWLPPAFGEPEFRQHAQLFDGKPGEANFYATDPGPATTIAAVDMSTDPGWAVAGAWAWGTPAGGGGSSGDPDPTSGHTGPNVYGYNLAGDYAKRISSTHYLTTTAFDCSEYRNVQLRFWRWLGIEMSAYDRASIQVSHNGSTWTSVWQNPNHNLSDVQWCRCDYDISAVADGNPTVYVRWGLGPTDRSVQFCGWNLDDFELLGVSTAVAPRIAVSGNSLPIANGDRTPTPDNGTDFGSYPAGSPAVTHAFVIHNTGDADLLLTGTPAVGIESGTLDSFTVVSQPTTTVAPGGTTQFELRFAVPAVPRTDSATLTIASNDALSGPYTFAVQGTGTGPDIRVAGFNRTIPSAQTVPRAEDGTDFGAVPANRGSVTRTFTVWNDGNTDLTLTGSPRAQVSGANAEDFAVIGEPAAVVPGGGSTEIQVRFTPGASGKRTAILTILSDDSDEPVYTFAVQGGVLTLRLWPGWNLVSFNVQPSPAAVAAVFPYPAVVSAVWGWAGTQYERVASIQPLTGYWVLCRATAPEWAHGSPLELSFAGNGVDPERNLTAGWNLIGPAQACFPPYGGPVSTPGWRYDARLRRFVPVRPDEALAPGQGYWLYTAVDGTVRLGEPTRGPR